MPQRGITYRPMEVEDIQQVIALEGACFPGIPPERYWVPGMLQAHIEKFPEGQMVSEFEGRIVGSATGLRVRLMDALKPHTWRSISGNGYLTTHADDGDALYGTEIMVHPDARRRGIARRLYEMRKDLVRRHNMRAFVTGGRIPGYQKRAERMSATEYVKSVLAGDRADRTLSAQLSSGLTVAGVMPSYITDPSSQNWATLLVWWNLDYQEKT